VSHVPKGFGPLIISGFFTTLFFQGVLTSTLSPLLGHLFDNPATIAGILLNVTVVSGLIQAAR
jgi:hypothetical protein